MNIFFTKAFLGKTAIRFESERFNISVVHYTQKVSEEWHFHEKVHLSSILQGGNLESRRTRDIQVNPGKVMAYHEGEVHRNRFTAHPSKNLNIEIEEKFFEDNLRFSNLKLDENTCTELLRIYFELLLNDSQSTKSCEQLLKSIFWEGEAENVGEWVSKIKIILHDRWNEFIPLQELSEEIQIHPITISKYFPKYVGMTLSNYMRKIKVKKAVQQIMNTTNSFADIAFSCGFSDQSHMVRLVKTYTGYTPGIIRSLDLG